MKRLLFILLMVVVFSGCNRSPEVVVWELKKGTTAADIGWKPSGAEDISFSKEGDYDFTILLKGESRTWQFHQRCWAIGASREGDIAPRPDVPPDVLVSAHAHFAKDITVNEAVVLARRVLEEWDGGWHEKPARGELTLEQFHEAVKAGTYYAEQWGVQSGNSGAGVRFSFRGPRSDGGKRRCTLTFALGT